VRDPLPPAQIVVARVALAFRSSSHAMRVTRAAAAIVPFPPSPPPQRFEWKTRFPSIM
jgi:hypothetical protein